MNYIVIYKNVKGKFRKLIFFYYKPNIGEFIQINSYLYRIDYIEHIPSEKLMGDYYEAKLFDAYSSVETVLYCSEVRNYQWEPKKHWLDDFEKIKEE